MKIAASQYNALSENEKNKYAPVKPVGGNIE